MGFFTKLFGLEDEPQRKRATKKDSSHIRITLDVLLDKYFYKEAIQGMCDEADLQSSGPKKELIEDLINNSEFEVEDFLSWLDMVQLKDLCEELDEYKSGRKDDLINRIIPHIDVPGASPKKK